MEAPLVAHFREQGHDSEDFKFLVLEEIKSCPFINTDAVKTLLKQ